jgi:hypothetical protein
MAVADIHRNVKHLIKQQQHWAVYYSTNLKQSLLQSGFISFSLKLTSLRNPVNGVHCAENGISVPQLYFPHLHLYKFCEISSSHGGEYEVQICLLGFTAV